MASVIVVQHAEKDTGGGDPALSPTGHGQAAYAAAVLGQAKKIVAVYSSPMRRALETADPIAARLGLTVTVDERLCERMNWDGVTSFPAFLAEWTRASTDRDYLPSSGDSSRAAGDRLCSALDDISDRHSNDPVVVVTHGGVTVDLLRNLIGDAEVNRRAPTLIAEGVPNCAITRLQGTRGGWQVDDIASTSHAWGRNVTSARAGGARDGARS